MVEMHSNRRSCLLYTATLLVGLNSRITSAVANQLQVASQPYAPSEVKVLRPRTADEVAGILPDTKVLQPKALTRAPGGLRRPPAAYVRTGVLAGAPAWLLFGIALQESQLAFGRAVLPYPWTLCVQGKGERYPSYETTVRALRTHLARGVRNIDCGAMQVNWGYHSDKLQTTARALDPYPNLAVGASILMGHYQVTGNWHASIGLYHTGSLNTAERRQRAARYADQVLNRLNRWGIDARTAVTPIALAMTPGGAYV